MKELTAKDLKDWMSAGKQFQLLDIREPWELEVASIGGVHIPMNDILKRSNEVDTNLPCVIYCRIGRRSANVVKALEFHRNFNNLYNLKGGLESWAKEVDPSMEIY